MASSRGIRSGRHGGFTLVELVAVILVLGILAFTAIPRFLNQGAIDVSAKAEQLASDIRYTQSLAMTSGQRNRININLATASYQITTSAGVPVTHPATSSTAAISLGNVSLALSGLSNSYVAFDGKGIPYTDIAGSGTVLGAPAAITLNAAGNTRQILISPQTGRVIVQ